MNSGQSRVGPKADIYARRQLRAIAARWDARADSWDHDLEDPDCCLNEDAAYRRFTRIVRRVVAHRRAFCAGCGVIDAGCGTGLVLEEVGTAFAWGVGIDISPRMIRLARAKHLARTKFLVGDCFRLPDLCPKAGAVLSRGVLLSHYGRAQGQSILKAARATLAPGGFLIFDFLNEAARTKYRHAPKNKTWFAGDEIQTMAERAGLATSAIVGPPKRRVLLLLAET
jgi:SAM-dependent methyltransferase